MKAVKKFMTVISRQTHTHNLLGYSRCGELGIHACWHYHKFWEVLCNSQKTESINSKSLFTHGAAFPFSMNNAWPHNSTMTTGQTQHLAFTVTDYPSYSPDLAPSDFHLFPKLKRTSERISLWFWWCNEERSEAVIVV